ncbi:MAG: hypothetical protein ACFFG0_23005, partial [Candidatus Thorarchaeota archaeon]
MVDITNYFDFENNIAKEVKIIGRIAEEIWQHLTMFVESHPYMNYFDLDDGYQIVIYSKDDIPCKKKFEVTGQLIKVESKHKNP